MNNFNFDENSINKLKEMLNKGELNDVISQIPPEMIQNFSQNFSQSNLENNSNSNFNNIDINTILKMKSIMEKMNSSNDPRANLLYSLKPYLRDSKKEKIDQYANLLNFAKIAELLKNDNKEKPDV